MPETRRAVRHASTSSTPRPSTGSPTSCAARSSTASSSPARRCARSRSPSRSASPGRPSARRSAVLVAEGLATREPNRGVARRRARPGLGPRRLPRPRGARGRRRTALARRAARSRATRCATALADYTAAVARRRVVPGAQRAAPRLPPLAGRPDRSRRGWSRWPRRLIAELRLALAQVDRIRRNAHDQAGSHTALVRLLESGDIDGAVGRARAAPRRTPRSRSSTRLHLER